MRTAFGKAIVHVEIHDARVARIELLRGIAFVEFEHLVAYAKVSDQQVEVWSFRARLALRDVTRALIDGPLADDMIIDGAVRDRDGDEVEWLELLDGAEVSTVEWSSSANAARVAFRAGSAVLELLEPLHRLEDWKGPLANH